MRKIQDQFENEHEAMLDTGADISAVSEEYASKLIEEYGFEKLHSTVRIKAADAHEIQSKSIKIKSFKLCVGLVTIIINLFSLPLKVFKCTSLI